MDPTHQSASSNSPKSIFVIVLVLALLGIVMAGSIVRNTLPSTDQDAQEEQEELSDALAPNVVVYGNWRNDRALIKAYNLSTGNTTVLARIGDDVKKVTLLSPDRLLFINKTDERDHGQELSVYSVTGENMTPIYTADAGFGIDDYVISPNGRYIAVWEVGLAPDSGILLGGSSRVYTMEMGKTEKVRMYDEVQSGETPVHYPRAVTSNGEVYVDTFLPNSGTGWAYGMSVSNLQGTQKQTLSNMANGTYGTQPSLSPDGRYLVFAGYDGSAGSGLADDEGYRRAIIRANTIELLDTATKQRRKLANIPQGSVFDNVGWDRISGKILYTAIAKTAANEGTFSYDLLTNRPEKIRFGSENQSQPVKVASYLSNGEVLIGVFETSEQALGNLGEGYGMPYTSLSILSRTDDSQAGEPEVTPVRTRDGLMQIIAVVPLEFFPQRSDTGGEKQGGQIAAAGANANKGKKNTGQRSDPGDAGDNCGQGDTMQLCSFQMKPALAPKRLSQQSGRQDKQDKNKDKDNGGKNGGGGGGNGGNGGRLGNIQPGRQQNVRQDNACIAKQRTQCAQNSSDPVRCMREKESVPGNCPDSPLYLYGIPGQQVSVRVNTLISNSNAPYNDGYLVTLLSDSKFQVGGKTFESITYDYMTGIKRFRRPTYGAVVVRSDLSRVLTEYAGKLGLNTKETADLVKYGKEKVAAQYIFVSFFDHATSHKLLPLTFTPKPDNYLNVVFYFKEYDEKPDFRPTIPVFTPLLDRSGFTAVEVSVMIE